VEDVAGSVGKLEKTIANTPGKLEALGIALAHNADGSVDVQRTLLNAADAFAATTDEVQRAKIGSELFGKSWQQMIPLLEKGASGLKASFDGVLSSKILSQDDIAQAEEFRLAMDDLKDASEGLMIQVGKGLVPTLNEAAKSLGQVTSAADSLTKPFGGLGKVIDGAIGGLTDILNPLKGVQRVAHDVDGALDDISEGFTHNKREAAELAVAHQNVATAVDKNRVEHGELIDTLGTAEAATRNMTKAQQEAADIATDAADRAIALRNAQDDQTKAIDRAAQATKIAADRIHEMARAASDATTTELDYKEAHRRTEQAVRDAEKAVKDAQKARSDPQAQADAEAAEDAVVRSIVAEGDEWIRHRGKIKETKDGAADYANKVQDSANGIRDRFPEIAAKLDEIAAKWYAISAATNDASGRAAGYDPGFGAGPIKARADGGPVKAGEPYLIGEDGPEIMVPAGSGVVLPNSALNGTTGGRALGMASTGGGSVTINITAMDGRDVLNTLNAAARTVGADAIRRALGL
jgi:methyl-accepting chemotaxis protein